MLWLYFQIHDEINRTSKESRVENTNVSRAGRSKPSPIKEAVG